MSSYAYLELTDSSTPPGNPVESSRYFQSCEFTFESSNWIPIFWTVMFVPGDELQHEFSIPPYAAETHRHFASTRPDAVHRLSEASEVFQLASQQTFALFSAWTELVAGSTSEYCLLRGDILNNPDSTEHREVCGGDTERIFEALSWVEQQAHSIGVLAGHPSSDNSRDWPPTHLESQ